MGPIAIVRGSTAYIPKGLVEESNITVAPRSPISGDQAYRNELDIQPDDFYARPKTAKVMPTTSQSAVVTMRASLDRWSFSRQRYGEFSS